MKDKKENLTFLEMILNENNHIKIINMLDKNFDPEKVLEILILGENND